MKIKDEHELMNVMGMAFAGYANRVGNGEVGLYKPFLNGGDKVYATIRLVGLGGLRVEEGPDVDGYEAEIKVKDAKIAELEKEVKALNLLLEKEKPPEEDILVPDEPKENEAFGEEGNLHLTEEQIEEATFELPEEEKPKSKRKKKK